MTADLQLMPLKIECCDAPVTSTETAAEVQARLARAEGRRLSTIVETLDDRGRVRLAELRSCAERGEALRQAGKLADFLTEGLSPADARSMLAIARNVLTLRMNTLICQEYDAECAANPGADFAQLAR